MLTFFSWRSHAMRRKMLVALTVALVVVAAVLPAAAQDSKEPKEVTVSNLVPSLGGFSATVNAPLFITGATVALEPGGQTGRQQFRVPTYIYVIEGILTTFYEAGPVGIQGAQYHAAGQSFMDNGGGGHNPAKKGGKTRKDPILHLRDPRGADTPPNARPEVNAA